MIDNMSWQASKWPLTADYYTCRLQQILDGDTFSRARNSEI